MSSGTSERRSRSPDMTSMAMFMAPTKAETSAKTDIMPSMMSGIAWPCPFGENETSITMAGPINACAAADVSERRSRK